MMIGLIGRHWYLIGQLVHGEWKYTSSHRGAMISMLLEAERLHFGRMMLIRLATHRVYLSKYHSMCSVGETGMSEDSARSLSREGRGRREKGKKENERRRKKIERKGRYERER